MVRSRFRHLLCPTDFSREADLALEIAIALSGPGATIHLMHVRQRAYVMSGIDAMPVLLPPVSAKQELASANRVLQRLQRLDRRLGVGRRRRVQYHVSTGPEAARHIVAFARDRDVDAIVLATHGRRGLERLLLGSVASAVAHRSRVPVILVHPGRRARVAKPRRRRSQAAGTVSRGPVGSTRAVARPRLA